MDQQPIGVAVVGCGGFATGIHIPNLAKLPAYRLHAVADVDEARAQRVAEQYGVAYATMDYTRILTDPAVELVVITTPHNEHAAMAIRINRKFTDMVPVIPGKWIFRVEANSARRKYVEYAAERAAVTSPAKLYASKHTPAAMVTPTNHRALLLMATPLLH